VAAHLPAEVQTVLSPKPEVGEDHVRLECLEGRLESVGVGDEAHLEAPLGEHVAEETAQVTMVLDDEDPGRSTRPRMRDDPTGHLLHLHAGGFADLW
jgi:hypothetical protein